MKANGVKISLKAKGPMKVPILKENTMDFGKQVSFKEEEKLYTKMDHIMKENFIKI